MIETRDLSFHIAHRRLVHQINLTVTPGRLLAIVGPNGAGKTTLLKLLNRDLLPTSGEVRFHGKPLSGYKAAELARKRAVLSQQNQLSLPFTVQEVVMMGRYPFHKDTPTSSDYDIVRKCLEKVDMLPFSGRLFPTLSGGEQQRVQLARVLAQIWQIQGAYLFLDEPTNGMDLKHQYHTLQIAKALTADHYGVVAVLHDLNMALQYADDLLILHNGTIAALGVPREVLTPEIIEQVFGIAAHITYFPEMNIPLIVPVPGKSHQPSPYLNL